MLMKKLSDQFVEKVREFQKTGDSASIGNPTDNNLRNNSGNSSTSSGFAEPNEFSNHLYSLISSNMHNNDKEKIYPNKSSENQPQQVTENGDSNIHDGLDIVEKDLIKNFNSKVSVSDQNLENLSQNLKQKATAYQDKVKSYKVRYIDVKSYETHRNLIALAILMKDRLYLQK